MRASDARKTVRLSDGVSLSMIDTGVGEPIVIVPEQLIGRFARTNRVIAIDMRGHGESDVPDFGYRISRFAADLQEILQQLEVSHATLFGHSMGCSVIWCYLEIFGFNRVSSLILADQGVTLVADPSWNTGECLEAGAVFTSEQMHGLLGTLRSADGETASRAVLGSMVSERFPAAEMERLVADNLILPREYAASLLRDHAFKDWRYLVARITVPTLCIGGKDSVVPWQAMAEIGRMIEHSRTVVLADNSFSSHFAFLESPQAFAEAIEDFLDANALTSDSSMATGTSDR